MTVPKYASFCSFCGKHEAETGKLVLAATASICRECVALCAVLAEVPHFTVGGAETTLGACPIGLFIYGETLCLKTEYRTEKGAIEAYIVESGEFFWGDEPQTVESQLRQKVTPVCISGGELDDAR